MIHNKKLARILWFACLLTTIAIGLAFLALAVLPYGILKPVADGLARDESLELFTPEAFSRVKPGLLLIATLGLICAAALIMWRRPFQIWAEHLSRAKPGTAMVRDFQELVTSLRRSTRQDRTYLYALGLITLLAAALRGLFLSTPMQHDEAYTFTAFASSPFLRIISDYHLPNNHVFHTILVYMTINLIGNQPWVVRLPAYLAGVLLVPATYFAGKSLYQRNIGLIAAGFVAISPVLVNYSTNARGYTLIALFTLLMATLGAYILRHKNGLAWGILTITAILGFYTMPTMLYPAGMVFTWLLLSWTVRDVSPRYAKSFLFYLIISGIATLALTVVLYTPILFKSGLSAIIDNQYIRTYAYPLLWDNLFVRITSTTDQWMQGLPSYLGILSLIGFVTGLVLHNQIAKRRFPLQVAALIWIITALAIQRVAPLSRVWLFLLPLYILWSLAGIFGIIEILIPRKFERKLAWLVILIAVLLPFSGLSSSAMHLRTDPLSIGIEEEITLYLKENLQSGDLVVVKSPMSTPMQYYFMRYNIPLEYFDRERKDIQRVFVIVSTRYDQTIESVLDRRGLDSGSYTSMPLPVHEYKHTTVYELKR